MSIPYSPESSVPRAETEPRRWAFLAAGLVAAAAILIYHKTLDYPFVYDDDSFVVLNRAIRSLRPLGRFFTDPDAQADDPQLARDVYRPLTTISYAVSYRLFGADPFSYHAFNVFLHALNSVLVFVLLFLLLDLLSPRPPPERALPAFAGALLFAVHPVQTEAVAWVSQRSILMSQVFFLAALLGYLRLRRTGSLSDLVWALAAFALSLLSKESAAVYVALPPLIEFALRRAGARRPARPGLLWALPAAAATLLIAYLAARQAVLGQFAQTHYFAGSLYRTALLMAKAFAVYVKLALFPSTLSIEYLFSVPTSAADPWVLLSLSVLTALAAAAWVLRRKRPAAALGLAWFFVSLAPVSNIVPIRTILNERFLYLPLVGLSLLAAHALAELLRGRGPRARAFVLGGFACLAAALGFRAAARVTVWSSGYALAASGLESCPQSAHLHYGMGRQYAARGEYDKALSEYELALAIDPAYHEALNSAGLIYSRRGDFNEALRRYRRTLQIKVGLAVALRNMGSVHLAKRDFPSAIKTLEAAAAADPKDPEIQSDLAAAYAQTGELERAVLLSRAALERGPGLTKTRYNLALFLGASGRVPQAMAELRRLLVLDPSHRPGREELARLVRLRSEEEASRRRSAEESELLSPRETRSLRLLREHFLGPEPRVRWDPATEFRALRDSRTGRLSGVTRGGASGSGGAAFVFPVDYGEAIFVAAGRAAVEMRPLGAGPVKVANAGGLLAYEEAFAATSVLFRVGPDSSEELLLLADRSAPTVFEYRLRGRGEVADFALGEDGALRAVDKTGRRLFSLSAPVVFDSAGARARGRFALRRERGGAVLAMSFDERGLRYPLLIDPTWTTDGGLVMATPRFGHTATLDELGQVLVAGGESSTGVLNNAEIYIPGDGVWQAAGTMSANRSSHTATFLPNGKILIAGGGSAAASSTAELYDSANGSWATTGAMTAGRTLHTATLLGNGKVLVVGGVGLSTAELYDPATGGFSATGSLSTTRSQHAATLLGDGKVLVTGGFDGAGQLSTAELYDPSAGTWAAVNAMGAARDRHSAVSLVNGQILVAGGRGGGGALSTAELYNPATGSWAPTGAMTTARERHTVALLPNGKLLAAAGSDGSAALASSEFYDTDSGAWTAAGPIGLARYGHSGVLLGTGRFMVAGGVGAGVLQSAEFFDPIQGTFATTGAMGSTRQEHSVTVLPNGKVLVAGGRAGATFFSTAELYDPALGTWATTNSMSTPRALHTANLLPDGKLLVAGGRSGDTSYLSSAEVYDSGAGTWSTTGAMSAAREGHSAARLPNGNILVTGGGNGSGLLSTAEVYGVYDGLWHTANSMNIPRRRHRTTITSGTDAVVLVTGGETTGGITATVETYDPTNGVWAAAASMSAPRANHSATFTLGGKVLVAGGETTGGAVLASAQVFDPDSDTWSAASNMTFGRSSHTATLLPSGKVMIAGGNNGSDLAGTELFEPGPKTFTGGNSLTSGRSLHGAVLLASGKLLVVGGAPGPLSTAELGLYSEYDFTLSSVAFRRPTIATVGGSGVFPVSLVMGSTYSVTGTSFTGLGGGSGGGFGPMDSPTNRPRALLRSLESGSFLSFEGGEEFDLSDSVYTSTEASFYALGKASTTLEIELVSELVCGHYDLTVLADAVPSVARTLKLLPVPPTGAPAAAAAPFAAVSSHSLTVRWVLADLDDVAGFRIQLSSSANFTGTIVEKDALDGGARTLDVPGLLANTTYYFRAATLVCGGIGVFSGSLGSTSTLTGFVQNAGYAGVTSASVTANWSAFAASPQAASAEGYRLEAALRDDFTGALVSSASAGVALSTLTVEGLAPNTTYYLRVGAFNWNGVASTAAVSGATATFANPPATVASTFTDVTHNGLGAAWSLNGNPLGSSSFTVQASTAADFNAGATDQVTLTTAPAEGPFATLTGLSANTTYYLRVRTVPHNGPAPDFVEIGSTRTLINPPAAAGVPFSAVGQSSASVAWSHNGNPVDVTTYTVVLTTGAAFPNAFSGNLSLTTNPAGAVPAASFLGLSPNTSYYLFGRGISPQGVSGPFVLLGSSPTLAMPAATAASTFVVVDVSSLSVNWDHNGNPAGPSQYQAVLSTASPLVLSHSGNVSITTRPAGALPQATLAGLSINATYFLFVSALNHQGLSAGFTTLGSTATMVKTPLSAASTFSALTPAGFGLSWDADGNPLGVTSYTVHVTTAFDFSDGATGAVTFTTAPAGAAFATVGGLNLNTTYYARVRAVNHVGAASYFQTLGATVTLTFPPATVASTFSMVGESSMSVAWSHNGNPVFTTTYTVVLTTGPVYPNAYAGNVALTTNPAEAVAGATVSGLSANTSYFLFIQSVNQVGAGSAFVAFGATATLSAVPASVASTFSAVLFSSFTAAWSGNGNPLGVTSYTVHASTASDFNAGVSDQAVFTTAPPGGLAATFTGLGVNTTYYFRVRSHSHSGIPSAYAALGATATLTLEPAAGPSVFRMLGPSSMTVSWSANGNPLDRTTYTLVASTATPLSLTHTGNVSRSTAPAGSAPTTTLIGLEINTTYYLFVSAVDSGGGGSAFVALGTTRTRLNLPAPAAPTFAQVHLSSMSVVWDANGNPLAVTTYTVALTTGAVYPNANFGNVSLTTNPAGAAPSATLAGLFGNTTYLLFIQTVDENGAGTGFALLGDTATAAFPPASAPPDFAQVGESSMTVLWSANGNGLDVTTYTVVLSTGAGFPNAFAGNVSLSTRPAGAQPAATINGLALNASYFLFVDALNHSGASTGFSALGSTSTRTRVPASAVSTFTAVLRSSFTALWDANGNALAVTTYTVQASTAADFTASSQVTLTTAPESGPAASVTGLGFNTTYYLRVRSLNHSGAASDFLVLGATVTLAEAPLSAIVSSVQLSSLSLSWNANGNPSGTQYSTELSTDAFATLTVTSRTLANSATFFSLLANTTCYLRVRAIGHGGGETEYATAAATPTLAAQPTASDPTGVTHASFTANWGANGNQPGTSYLLELSTDSFGTLNLSSVTKNTAVDLTGLSPNTTYYTRVRGVAHSGIATAVTVLPSTMTFLLPPTAPAVPFSTVDAASATVSWGDGGNSAGTQYLAELSTDAFATVNVGSATKNLSARFGTGGQGPALTPNTTFHARVTTLGPGGPGAYVSLGSTASLCVQPSFGGAPFLAVGVSSVAVSWQANGNPLASSSYTVQLSTAPDFTAGDAVTLTTAPAAGPTGLLAGLSVNTTYYLRVRAVNHQGVPTQFSSGGSTVTHAPAPAAAAQAFPGIELSSMTVLWDLNGNLVDLTTYTVTLSTGSSFPNAFSGNVTLSTVPAGSPPAATLSGLSINTTYHLFVRARNHAGVFSAYAAGGSTATRAALPAAAAVPFAAAGSSSMTVAWLGNGNPLGVTSYTVVLTTGLSLPNSFAGNFSLTTAPAGAALAATATGLSANTSYFLFVAAVNHNGVASAFAAFGSSASRAALPATLASSFTAVNLSSMSVAWSANGNPLSVTTYTVQLSSSQNFDALDTVTLATMPAGNPTATLSGLLGVDTTYYLRVRASNHGGLATAFVNLGSTATLAREPVSASASAAHVSSASLVWSANGNPAYTLFSAETSTDAFATLSDRTTALANAATFFALTPNSTYYLRVRALNSWGAPTAYALAAATFTSAAPPAAAATGEVGDSSVTANWSANANPALTQYSAQISTDLFATVNSASATIGLSALFNGLLANTTYYLRVRSVGINGSPSAFTTLPSTITSAFFPGQASPGFPSVDGASVTVAWTNGGNPAGTRYTAQVSTDAFATILRSSETFNLSVLFGTGGEGSALAPNTTHYFRVSPLGAGGQGPFVSLGATSTLAALPLAGAESFAAVEQSSFSVLWNANGNALAVTTYTVQVATASDFASADQITLATVPATGPAGYFSGLSVNTSYYLRIRAFNHNGVPTAFALLGSTATRTGAPETAQTSFTLVGISSMSVAWGRGANPLDRTSYTVVLTTGPSYPNAFAGNAVLSTVPAGASPAATASGLAANTSYFLFVEAVDSGGRGSGFAALGATSSLSAVPAALGLSFAEVGASSMSVAWSANGNPLDRTTYSVVLTTGPSFPNGFANISLSTVPAAAPPSATLSGLSVNTSYYLFAAAVNHNGVSSPYEALGATATRANAPLSAASTFTAVAVSSLSAVWDRNGNPLVVTSYTVQLSTAPDFSAADGVSITTAPASGPEASFGSLSVNTTYYLRLRAVNHAGVATPYLGLGSTATLANPPAAAGIAELNISSLTVAWSANDNPSGTVFTAEASTDAFATISVSSRTAGVAASFAALAANATYYLRVRAENRNSVATGFSVATATSTSPAQPTALSPSGVTHASVTANWGANGNAFGTVFEARISTDDFSTVNESSVTIGAAAAFLGLTPNTSYYLQVRARGNNGSLTAFTGLSSTMTAPLPPGAADPVFPSVEKGSIAFAWTDGGNGAGIRYLAQVSTDDFATVNAGSETFNLSALFGAGGAGPNLTVNTTYHFQVRANGPGGPGPFQRFGSTATPANAPAGTTVLSVGSTTVTLDWSPNGNPEPGSDYELWRATENAFVSPVKTIVSSSAHVPGGLAQGGTFYFKVRTKGHNGVFTGFDAAVSTVTLPPAPGPTGIPAGTALGVSSISFTWSAATGAANYELFVASQPQTRIAAPVAAAFIHVALATNTGYGILVGGINAGGLGPLAGPVTSFTLAAPPAATASPVVEATSATLSWSLNTNPSGTTAEVQRSTDSVSFSSVALGAMTSYIDYGLAGCTTYYYRVRNKNGDGIATLFDSVIQFKTKNSTPAAPGSLTAESLAGRRILLSWVQSPSADVSAYRLYYDSGTGTIDYAAAFAAVSSSVTSFTTGVLSSSAAYRFGLRAVNACGVEESNAVVSAAAASVESLPSVRAAVAVPQAGKRVKGNRVTVVASLTAGSVGQTRQVLFQYRASSATGSWSDLPAATANNPNPDSSYPYFIHWDASALAANDYDLRAVASDLSNSSDTVPASVTLSVVSGSDFDIEEKLVSGQLVKSQVLSNGTTNTISAADGTSGQLMRLVIPVGALSESTVAVSITNNPSSVPAVPGDKVGANASVEITLANGQTALAGGKTAAVTFTVPDANGDGFVDGTAVRVKNLAMFAHDGAGPWRQEFASSVDESALTVLGNTPHFSFFALFANPAHADLSSLRVYPVPFRPNNGDPDDGVPFSAGNADSGIIFDKLPERVTIRIYTVTGERVAEFSTGITDRAQWNAKNDDGVDVASGGYVAVIESSGQKTVIRKLLIIR